MVPFTLFSMFLSSPKQNHHAVQVTNVMSPDPDGTYAPGDVVTVRVTFDRYVSVVGEPVFHLNTGKGDPGRAVYAGGSGSQARENAHQG